jgi:hypothetical protein
MCDQLQTGSDGQIHISLADGTDLTLSANSKVTLDQYVYDPNNTTADSSRYSFLGEAFEYISGLVGKNNNSSIEACSYERDYCYGSIGIRGTKFILQMDESTKTAEINLIEGALDVAPRQTGTHTLFKAPVKITMTTSAARGSPLTSTEYDALNQRLFHGQVSAKAANSGHGPAF